MLIISEQERSKLEEVSNNYVSSDFEDTDLCSDIFYNDFDSLEN